MEWLLIPYGAIVCLFMGFTMVRSGDTPWTNAVMSMVWPVTLLIVVGYSLGVGFWSERDK